MDWQASTLGEVFDVRDGTHDSPKYQDEGYPLITSKNLKNGNLSFEKVNFISKVDFEKINTRSEVHKGDVLFAMIGTIGNPVLITEEPVFSIKNVALFKVPKTQSGKFLKYYLESSFVTEKMFKEAKGSTQKFVGLGYLRTFPISLPPIPEQQRIVAILDQAFADIEKARANAEKNLKNARELFDSYLNQVFSQHGEGWVETVVGDQLTLQRGFDITKKQQRPGEIPVVSSGGIKSYHDTSMVKGPGVVIGRKGSLGTVFFLEDDYWPHDTTLWVKDFKGNSPRLIYYYFLSLDVKHLDSGAANPALNRNLVHPIPTMWPSRAKQSEVLSYLDKLSEKLPRLEELYLSKLNSLDELKKSLLQKAFSGELTKTEGQAA
jgi:type I restriction enzyme S subunit